MKNHIIESIGHWGVMTTPTEYRLARVRAGDIIETPDALRRYPISCRYGRIANIDENGIAHICDGMGSAYLCQNGNCDISGGPWWSMPTSLLEPARELHEATYWNWGDHSPGAGQGVYYNIYRPLHRPIVHPDKVKQRYARDQIDARKGKYSHENMLDEKEWSLFMRGKQIDSDGEYLWVFRTVESTPTLDTIGP